VLGYRPVLAFGALYQVGSVALMLALPKARTVPAGTIDTAAAASAATGTVRAARPRRTERAT
jgi:hypothetical protein